MKSKIKAKNLRPANKTLESNNFPFQKLVDKSSLKYGLQQHLSTALKEAFKIDLKPEEIHVEYPQDEKFGDYSTNIAMILVSQLGKKPREIAEKIISELKIDKEFNKTFGKVELAGPGFINFQLSNYPISNNLKRILREENSYGTTIDKKLRFMIEFGQPNTHKMPHIGHLFSYILGESLSRIFRFMGLKIFKANYQGDIGPHVAKCIWAFLKYKPQIPDNSRKKAEMLQLMYQKGATQYIENKDAKKEIDALNKKIYLDKEDVVQVWKETRQWSLDFYKEFEKRLGVRYDRYYYESEAAGPGKEIVEKNIGKVFRESKGAIIFEGSKFGLHDRVFITSRGTPTYEAKDMALQDIKHKEWPYDALLITTASEQNEYFKVVFKALEQLDNKYLGKLFHLGFGMINLKSGKMSSRTGHIITGVDLIDRAITAILELIKGRTGLTKTEKERIAEKVGIGAIKFSFLKTNPLQDRAFDLKESINFEGNSGPYLQYTYARANSILKEAERYKLEARSYKLNNEELSILRSLIKFPDIVFEAGKQLSPNLICTYLFDLAQKFNLFYKKHKVLTAPEDKKYLRLAITAATAQVIKNGLNLLGIEVLDRM